VLAHQGVQPAHALHAFGEASGGQLLPIRVQHAHVMVMLGPVDPDEDHRMWSSFARGSSWSQADARGTLMEQRSKIGASSHQPSAPAATGQGTI
jgi:hypothetical protein